MDVEDIDKEVLAEVLAERRKQDKKWGVPFPGIPMGCSEEHYARGAGVMRELCERRVKEGNVTWVDILNEEVWEFFGEDSWKRQREELIQIAAVAVRTIGDGDRANAGVTS